MSLAERNKPGDRWRTLELARKHAKWAKVKEEQDRKRQDDQEAERCKPLPSFLSCIPSHAS